ncbi:hypothetical protein [Vagococcus acidifermentans]|uniref:Uncharacterized protein n=1 Tax=Vagococcus acidifermentans TaxID=564710 RepID=A0A430AN80_9ENTE|nr:hypothetical protein [Vagococcus acidifermentans]RSU09377.1 hypothetical protein CBF27_12650 [Vagococcus acidifermentans]
MGEIKKIVYQIGGDRKAVTVKEARVSQIIQDNKSHSFKVFNEEGQLSLEVYGVIEVHYNLLSNYDNEEEQFQRVRF